MKFPNSTQGTLVSVAGSVEMCVSPADVHMGLHERIKTDSQEFNCQCSDL